MTTENGEPTIYLGSGSYYDFRCPEEAEITIEDVAFGLAAASRFAGQCRALHWGNRRVRYTVAEHCVRGSMVAPPELQYAFLMHEAGEAVCGDMVAPLKMLVPEFRLIEKRCERAGHVRFGVGEFDREAIKLIDRRMLATEKRDLMATATDDDWERVNPNPPPPFEEIDIVCPWNFDEAADRFLGRFAELAPPEIAEREGVFVL